MLDEVHTFSKIKDNSINDIIKTTKFLFLCGCELTSTNLNGCYQERLEFPGRLPQVTFCLIHFQ